MKTAELTGTALDWAIAKCEIGVAEGIFKTQWNSGERKLFCPSTNWTQGGPIIEREIIAISCPRGFGWVAELWQEKTNPITGHITFGGGDTPLLAAMRCYVASKLGSEVEIPEELLK